MTDGKNTWKTLPLADVAIIERNAVSPATIKNGTLYVGLEHLNSAGGFVNVGPVQNGDLASTKFQFTPDQRMYLRRLAATFQKPSGTCEKSHSYHSYCGKQSMIAAEGEPW
jgi:hypothetical protein